ncbi:MAG: hypothetical protein AABX60_00120 [Nanoarchaeota archaeon]
MIVRFSASNIVGMIFFIPILLVLGLILAFLVPLLALMIVVASILFLGMYAFAKIGLVKKQRISISNVSNGNGTANGKEKGKKARKKASAIEVKDYKVR